MRALWLRPLLVLLFGLSLLSSGCARPNPEPSSASPVGDATAAPPVPTAGGAAETAVPAKTWQGEPGGAPAQAPPYRSLVRRFYYTYYPDKTRFAHHGELEVLDPTCPPVQVLQVPVYPEHRPENLTTSSNLEILRMSEIPGGNPRVALAILVRPKTPLAKGAIWAYDIQWEQKRVPYLHDEQGGADRLMSLSVGAAVDRPQTWYVIAVPDNVSRFSVFDFKPRQRKVPGWTVLEFNATDHPRFTMHVGFRFAGPPSAPPPTVTEVFDALPR